MIQQDVTAIQKITDLATQSGLNVAGGDIVRTSSRFCLGVEHGDYNGTELFGVGTDRFIWLAFKPNNTNTVRLFSGNFENDGLVTFDYGTVPSPKTVVDSWARFPFGVEYILRKNGYKLTKGFDAVLYGNIPGGGMSRSASLTLNLMITMFDVNGLALPDGMRTVELAQAVENEYIGSPCGLLDQIMIYFAKESMGTHFNPKTRAISYVPLGSSAPDFSIVGMDTGTVRPGLEKSTYKVRRAQCEELVQKAQEAGFKISCLADIKDDGLYNRILERLGKEYPQLCGRMTYIYKAQKRFYQMLDAFKAGDIATVGNIFRQDGIGLRDEYVISGPELETMCDIARTVPGVLGERMLGGGDKGVSGAIVLSHAVEPLGKAVDLAYPLSHPDYKDKYAVNVFKTVSGITRLKMSQA